MTDVLVIGGGLAGLRAAIAARESGASVVLASKVHPLASHSVAATGGINVALHQGDSWQAHAADTLAGGAGLADVDAVAKVCSEAAAELHLLERWGVPFDREHDGRIGAKALAGSRLARTVAAGDHTGKSILQALWEASVRAGVTIRSDCFLIDVAVRDGVCRGAVLWDVVTGDIFGCPADAVVLATGGMGQLYAPTTNAAICTGDGLAAALRAGAAALDLEMTQFYPTCLPERGICVTEEARAHGATLVNDDHERFLARYDADRMEMASRDVLCRALFAEAQQGQHVWLDCTQVAVSRFDGPLKSFAQLIATLTDVDVTRERLPVQPAMHYHMGGIETDLSGLTSVPGLYAAGECACLSVHGANRIGGNSLLETLVMGRTAGAAAGAQSATVDVLAAADAADQAKHQRDELGCRSGDGREVTRLRRTLGALMTKEVGILRDEAGLTRAAAALDRLATEAAAASPADASGVFNQARRRWYELSNLVDIGRAVTAAARARRETRGAHCRVDLESRDTPPAHTRTVVDRSGGLSVAFAAVRGAAVVLE